MTYPLIHSRRALTEVVSYVVLMIIAVSISTLVYSYLHLSTPKDRPACPEGVSLTVSEATCTLIPKKLCVGSQGGNGKIDITLANNGKRSISGVYLRLSSPGRKVKELLNKDSPFFSSSSSPSQALLPGQTLKQNYVLALENEITKGEQELEIEPLVGTPGKLALCENTIVLRKVVCDLPGLKNVPATIPGVFQITYQKEPGTVKMTVTPDASYAEGIDHMEVSLCRKDSSGRCISVDNSPRTLTCPDSSGKYIINFGGLSSGDYEMRGEIILLDNSRVPIGNSVSSGQSVNFFSILSCIGQCENDAQGARIRRNSDGAILCHNENTCADGRQTRIWSCNERCYTGNSNLDGSIFVLGLYNCNRCSASQPSCDEYGGGWGQVYYAGC